MEVNLQANTFKAFYENYARLLKWWQNKDGMVEGYHVFLASIHFKSKIWFSKELVLFTESHCGSPKLTK